MHFVRHVGASWAGNECQRYIWLRWHNIYDIVEIPPPVTASGLNICEIGKRSEEAIVARLRTQKASTPHARKDEKTLLSAHRVVTTPSEAAIAGVDISNWHLDPNGDPNEQFHILHPDYPFVSGFMDGVLVDNPSEPVVLEIKTMSAEKFGACRIRGITYVYPMYSTQIQLYMYLTGIKRGMFAYAARAPDGTVDPTNPMFFRTEYVESKPQIAIDALDRIRMALNSEQMPEKPKVVRDSSGRPIKNGSPCSPFCPYAEICAARDINADTSWPIPTCRSCAWYWKCSANDEIKNDFNLVCRKYQPETSILPARMRRHGIVIEDLEDYLQHSQIILPENVILVANDGVSGRRA